jgi:glyoxylase-like metal-dependent hydrolase (beta-lactamase superfamily II)
MTTQDVETPEIIQLADNFYVRQEIDNMVWADLGGKTIVIDTLEHAEKESEVFQAIDETIGRQIDVVINTHTHYDHVALNDAFARRHDAEIVNMDTRQIDPDGLWIQGDRRKLQILPMPGCHTETDCVIWFPDDAVLCIGDLFGWGLIPLTRNIRQAEAEHLMDVYDRLIAFGAETVVPGHGPLVDTDTLRRYVEYFHWLLDEVHARLGQGQSDSQIQQALGPPEDIRHWWRFTEWKHEDSLSKVIKSIRNGWLKPFEAREREN